MDGLNCRIEETEERISELEGRAAEITWSEQQKVDWINKQTELQGYVKNSQNSVLKKQNKAISHLENGLKTLRDILLKRIYRWQISTHTEINL